MLPALVDKFDAITAHIPELSGIGENPYLVPFDLRTKR
jgi:hypothetical protein